MSYVVTDTTAAVAELLKISTYNLNNAFKRIEGNMLF